MEALHLYGRGPVGSPVDEAGERLGLRVTRLSLAQLRADGAGGPPSGWWALRRPRDLLVLDGDEDWDSLLADLGAGHPAGGLPVVVIRPGARPGFAVSERAGRVVVRLDGDTSSAAVTDGLSIALRAARRTRRRVKATGLDRAGELLGGAADVAVATDAEGVLLYLNPPARALVGLAADDDVPALPAGEVFSVDEVDGGAADAVARAREAGAWAGRARIRLPSGEWRTYEGRLTCQRGADGAVRGWSVLAHESGGGAVVRSDLSPRVLDEIAHELNNPLGLTRTFLEIAAGMDVSPAVAEALRGALAGTHRLAAIIRDLPRLATPDAVPLEPVRPNDVVRAAVALADPQIRGRAELVLDLGAVPTVHSSESRLGQVLLNLVLNALQSMDPARAAENRLTVRTRRGEDGRVSVSVEDTGPGIPAAALDRIFEPFYTTRRDRGGAGLGLHIVRSLVASMGGEIEVDSRPGAGARFRVWLQPAAGAEAAAGEGRLDTPIVPIGAERRARVLVVDDELLVGRALRRLLVADHDVETVLDAREVLTRLDRGERFDIILCDLMMPGMGGMELHAELSVRYPDVVPRVVFLTGGAQNRRAAAFLDQVPNVRLYKPFDASVLKDLLRDTLAKLPPIVPPASPPTP